MSLKCMLTDCEREPDLRIAIEGYEYMICMSHSGYLLSNLAENNTQIQVFSIYESRRVILQDLCKSGLQDIDRFEDQIHSHNRMLVESLCSKARHVLKQTRKEYESYSEIYRYLIDSSSTSRQINTNIINLICKLGEAESVSDRLKGLFKTFDDFSAPASECDSDISIRSQKPSNKELVKILQFEMLNSKQKSEKTIKDLNFKYSKLIVDSKSEKSQLVSELEDLKKSLDFKQAKYESEINNLSQQLSTITNESKVIHEDHEQKFEKMNFEHLNEVRALKSTIEHLKTEHQASILKLNERLDESARVNYELIEEIERLKLEKNEIIAESNRKYSELCHNSSTEINLIKNEYYKAKAEFEKQAENNYLGMMQELQEKQEEILSLAAQKIKRVKQKHCQQLSISDPRTKSPLSFIKSPNAGMNSSFNFTKPSNSSILPKDDKIKAKLISGLKAKTLQTTPETSQNSWESLFNKKIDYQETSLIPMFEKNTKNLALINVFQSHDSICVLNIPEKLSNDSGFCLLPGNRLFYCCGSLNQVTCLDCVYIIDLTTKIGFKQSPASKKRSVGACICINDRVYSFGGIINNNPSSLCEIFNLNEDSWMPGPRIPIPSYNIACSALDAHIILSGFGLEKLYLLNIANNSYKCVLSLGSLHKVIFTIKNKVCVLDRGMVVVGNEQGKEFSVQGESEVPENLALASFVLVVNDEAYFILSNSVLYRFRVGSGETRAIGKVPRIE